MIITMCDFRKNYTYEINNKKKLLIKLDTRPHHACLSTQNKRENIHLEIDRNFVTLNEWDTCFVEINYRLRMYENIRLTSYSKECIYNGRRHNL